MDCKRHLSVTGGTPRPGPWKRSPRRGGGDTLRGVGERL